MPSLPKVATPLLAAFWVASILLLNAVQSDKLKYPLTDPVACPILIVFPDFDKGAVTDIVFAAIASVT